MSTDGRMNRKRASGDITRPTPYHGGFYRVLMLTPRGEADSLGLIAAELRRLETVYDSLCLVLMCESVMSSYLLDSVYLFEKSNHGVSCRFFSMETTYPNRAMRNKIVFRIQCVFIARNPCSAHISSNLAK